MNTFKDIAIVTVTGGVVLAWAGAPAWRALRAAFWPRAEGTVISSYLSSSTDRRVESQSLVSSASSQFGPRENYQFYIVEYTYTVGGTTYTSDRRRFVLSGKDSRSVFWTASGMARKYPVGKKVMVYYNPAQPSYSVLTLSLSLSNYFALALGLCGFLSGVYGLVRLALR